MIQILRSYFKVGQNDGREEHDSESNYSGDVSNTDSGRGPSEEGGEHHNNGENPNFNVSPVDNIDEKQRYCLQKTNSKIFMTKNHFI